MNDGWIKTNDRLPETGVEVETKVSDFDGIRNIQNLIHENNLWWIPDMSMYVYYRPTHWRPRLSPLEDS